MRLVSSASRILLGAVVALIVAAAPAATFTVATFADPAVNQSTPLFTLDGTQFTGGWSGLGLNLLTPGIGVLPDITDAKFSLGNLTATPIGPGFWTLTGGLIDFTNASNTSVFTIQFDAATLASNVGFGASDLALQNVVFAVPGHPELTYQQERFAFSFANDVETPTGMTWTAAFTSSAIPEPASIAMLLMGGLLSLLRRR